MQVRAAAPTAPLESDPNSGLLYIIFGMLTMAAVGLFAFLAYQATHTPPTRTPAVVVASETPQAKPTNTPARPSPRPERTSSPLAVKTPAPPQPRPVYTPPPPRPVPTRQPVVEQPSLTHGYPSIPQASVPKATPRPKPSDPDPVETQPFPEPGAPTPIAAQPQRPQFEPFGDAPPTSTKKPGGQRISGPGWVWYPKTRTWEWEWEGHPQPFQPPPPPPDGGRGGPAGLPGY